ncbi:MAG: sugar lactone lactonase YvrE, partial [Planctomycetota bacterium]
MRGSLALHDGVLWVGRHEKTAHVSAFDLDGRPLGRAFSFRNEAVGYAAVSGLAMDQDHRIWVADTPSGCLRCFTVFGAEVAAFGGASVDCDVANELAEPVDVDLFGPVDDQQLVIASGGRRRHAVRLMEPNGQLVLSLRPLGDPRGQFVGLAGVTTAGRLILVSESGAERIQVFRDGDFHFAFRPVVRDFGRRPVAT